MFFVLNPRLVAVDCSLGRVDTCTAAAPFKSGCVLVRVTKIKQLSNCFIFSDTVWVRELQPPNVL